MTTQERIEIMQAFSEGNSVEYFDGENWNTDSNPSWNWFKFTWRIKSPLTYIPFTFEDKFKLINTVIEHKETKSLSVITNVNPKNVTSSGTVIKYETLLEKYNFIDGTPCGKLQENN